MEKNKAFIFVPALLGMLALLIAWPFYRNSRIEKRFSDVHVGMSSAEVIRLLGKPSRIEPCGTSFGTSKPNCTEYIYNNSFAPLIPEYYLVTLDSSGHVLDTEAGSSP
jgi:hypothetical protein